MLILYIAQVLKANIDNENKFDFDVQGEHSMNNKEEVDEKKGENNMDTLSIFIQRNKDKIRNISENRKSYEEIKDTINIIIKSKYQDFVKVLISIEIRIQDEIYNNFMANDVVNFINDYFDYVQYDL